MNRRSVLMLLLVVSGSLLAATYHGSSTYNTYRGLVMAGYQGWFDTPDDGAGRGWYHYEGRDGFFPGCCTIDLWPEVSEYEKLYRSPFRFDDGSHAYLPSPHDYSTVDTHFRWMQEYGLDGVFLQRFVGEISNPSGKNHFDTVMSHAMTAANKYGRAVGIMYDLSGMPANGVEVLVNDIRQLAVEHSLFNHSDNPSYLYHNGKPLVTVWGLGFNDHRRYGIDEGQQIVTALKEMGFSVMLGVPTHWRELTDDTESDARLHDLIRQCDIVMPWFVGRYNEGNFGKYKSLIKKDLKWAQSNNVDYAPLCFPGFSWKNMHFPRETVFIPRNKGSFFWKQLQNAIDTGAEMIYIAMFDEIDEGTAIFKCAHRVPAAYPGSDFLPMEDGVPSDHYLTLAGKASRLLKEKLTH